jgi:hypothetical protein
MFYFIVIELKMFKRIYKIVFPHSPIASTVTHAKRVVYKLSLCSVPLLSVSWNSSIERRQRHNTEAVLFF